MFLQRYAPAGSRTRGFHATGGTVIDFDGIRVHRFTWSNQFHVLRGSAEVEVFVLGPGERGGWRGGLGGQLIQESMHLSPGTYVVDIRNQPPPGQPGFGFSRFAHLEARHSPHPIGSSAHHVSGQNIEIWYEGGGSGPVAGGAAVGGGGGRGGHGADGTILNLWGQQIRVGAGGGGGARRRFGPAGQTQLGGQGGAGGGGTGGAPLGPNGGNATGYGNGGGGAGGNLLGEPNQSVGVAGEGSIGFVVVRYPLELLEAA